MEATPQLRSPLPSVSSWQRILTMTLTLFSKCVSEHCSTPVTFVSHFTGIENNPEGELDCHSHQRSWVHTFWLWKTIFNSIIIQIPSTDPSTDKSKKYTKSTKGPLNFPICTLAYTDMHTYEQSFCYMPTHNAPTFTKSNAQYETTMLPVIVLFSLPFLDRVAQACLKPTVQFKLTLNFWSFCLHFPSAHYVWLLPLKRPCL